MDNAKSMLQKSQISKLRSKKLCGLKNLKKIESEAIEPYKNISRNEE